MKNSQFMTIKLKNRLVTNKIFKEISWNLIKIKVFWLQKMMIKQQYIFIILKIINLKS
jgi:hypothetical protein